MTGFDLRRPETNENQPRLLDDMRLVAMFCKNEPHIQDAAARVLAWLDEMKEACEEAGHSRAGK